VTYKGDNVGGNLFYIQDDVAYAHLSAFSPEGYDLGAPYAVKWIAIQHLAKIVRYINFGGAPSQEQDSSNGLSHFKQGWSNEIRKSYFCGKILNPTLYHELSRIHPIKSTWFPAYRAGEYDG
jgi:lipid II:glycine glycyltransferase (peptidoglycan interpeptide bridge formation enzyme)